jgi:hypothetical protein
MTETRTSRLARSAVTQSKRPLPLKSTSCGRPATRTRARTRSRRASMIVTVSVGGLETATKRPSGLAATLWGPAGTRSRDASRQGRPRSTATASSRSSATYATAPGVAGRTWGVREAARSPVAPAPTAAASAKSEARARRRSPVAAVRGRFIRTRLCAQCGGSDPLLPDPLPSRAEGPPRRRPLCLHSEVQPPRDMKTSWVCGLKWLNDFVVNCCFPSRSSL